jgi:SAM-dependent methyltransferase
MPRLSTEQNGDGYYGVVAEGYDIYLGDVDFGDAAIWRDALTESTGPALELACGTGRVLLPLRRAGFAVEGLDASAEMLAICAAKAERARLSVDLHHAAMERFDMGRRYGAIYCPLGSLMLLTAPGALAAALACALRHLAPDGLFTAALDRLDTNPDTTAPGPWRPRRSGHRDGTEYRVRERAMPSPAPGVWRSEMEHTVTRGGVVVAQRVKPFDLLCIDPGLIVAQLTAAGFTGIDLRDPSGQRTLAPADTSYVVRARQPAAVR